MPPRLLAGAAVVTALVLAQALPAHDGGARRHGSALASHVNRTHTAAFAIADQATKALAANAPIDRAALTAAVPELDEPKPLFRIEPFDGGINRGPGRDRIRARCLLK